LSLVTLACASPAVAADADENLVRANSGMVVCVSPPASEVGLAVLRQGGNAVDAAVATALALAVTWPEAGSLAGGGLMLIQPAGDRQPVTIDYCETAPAEATAKLFAPDAGPTDHRLIATPGTLRGLWLAHQEYGAMAWSDLVAPVERLAREGFEIDAAVAHSLNGVLNETPTQHELQRVLRPPGGGSWQQGARFKQPDLARTLALIADQGIEPFYSGSLATGIVSEARSGGGTLSTKDLNGYAARIRAPEHGVYRGYDIYVPPPPSSGGIALIEMLNIIEPFELRIFDRWSPFTVHLTSEAMRRADADAGKFLGDPEFDSIPLHLTSKQYARQIARQIDPARAPAPHKRDPIVPSARDPAGAAHFCVCDESGMAVSNSFGLGRPFGSRIVPAGTGIILNCAMAGFADFGAAGSGAAGARDERPAREAVGRRPNALEPGKRMLTSATPALVSRNGRLTLVTGIGGGSSTSAALLCVLVNMLEFNMDPRSAIDAPRWRPHGPGRSIQFEGYRLEAYSGAVRGLQLMGHPVEKPPAPFEDAHSIWIHNGVIHGAADRRVSGAAAGY
jgi:gamma-glutamyltranspeptidase/glutathione hydrolase